MFLVLFIIAGTFFKEWMVKYPEIASLYSCLQRLERLQGRPKKEQERENFEIYVAGRFASAITNPATWTSFYAKNLASANQRELAERALAEHPNPSDARIQQAAETVDPYLQAQQENSTQAFSRPFFLGIGVSSVALVYVGLPSLLAGLLFRGGLLLRLLGLAVVRSDGTIASRGRVTWRCLISWSPLIMSLGVASILSREIGENVSVTLGLILLLGLLLWSALRPHRTLQDRLAGTWLVPR